MRILFWSEQYLPLIGGVEVFARALSRALVDRGHECELITNLLHPSQPSTERDGGTTIHRLPLQDAFARQDLKAVLQARRAIQEIRTRFQPEVEHVHFNGPILRIQQMASPAMAPRLVATLHLLVEQVTGSPAVQRLLQDSRATLIALSRGGFETIRAEAPALARQLRCINNSLPPAPVAPAALPWDPPVLLALGRLTPEKGLDTALHAFARLAAYPAAPRLIVSGDGPDRARLEALAVSLGLTDGVRFTGWTPPDDVPRRFNEATIVLVPSRWKEPFGLVALEAAQMGRPVVASRTGGLADVVVDGVTGRLVPPDDPVALGDAIVALLQDRSGLERMGQAAHERAAAEFDFNHFIDQHLALYGS
jgi:glycogen(starch) synthase